MSNRLNIYACSGIGATGATKIEDRLIYDLEGSKTLENTKAMNMLLSHINYQRALYLYGEDADKAYILNVMDIYAVCYWFAKKYRDDLNMLDGIGKNIGIAIAHGDFKSDSTELAEHEERVEKLIDRIENESGSEDGADENFMSFWREYVVTGNTEASDEKMQQAWEKAVSGIGATDKYGINSDSDLSKFLNDAGSYFTYYMCVTRSEARRISKLAAWKWDKQKEVYDYCVNCFVGVYGTEESMVRIIESGIMETYDRSLDKIHDQIVSGEAYEVENVGLAAAIIAAIISAITAIVLALISGIISYAQAAVKAKYTVPEDTDSAIMSEDDYTGGTTVTTASMGGIKPLLFIGGIATVAALFGKKI